MSNSYRNLFTAALIVALLLVISAETRAQRKEPTKKNPAQERSLSGQDLARRILPGVVLIDCDDGIGNHSLGSGFFIEPGTVVTNHHVIKDMIRGEVRTVSAGRARRSWQISAVRRFDEDSDLALLTVSVGDTDKPSVLPLAKDRTVIGETIYAFGNPEGLAGTISPGIVSGLRSFKSGRRIQITAPISPGSSGGPVVNTRGEVIGIAEGSIIEGQNLNFAIPASLVTSLLEYDYLVDLLGDGPLPSSGWPRSETATKKGTNTGDDTKRQSGVIGPLKADESVETASLRGLKDVYVVVETLPPGARKITSEVQIRTDIELQLRREGIRVSRALTHDTLYVTVSVGRGECEDVNVYYYQVHLDLLQAVLLERDKSFSTFASTWNEGSMGIVGEGTAASMLKISLASLVNKFINDFLAAQKR